MGRVTFCSVVLALTLVAMLAPGASAQTGKHLALGVGVGLHKYSDDNRFESKSLSFSALYRFALHPENRKDGWRLEPSGSVGWGRTNTNATIGGVNRRLGKFRSIPLMIGGGPSYRHDEVKVGLTLVGGMALNHFTVDDGARTAYQGLGENLNSVETSNAFAGQAGVSMWYDLSHWVGLHASVGYYYHRPNAKTTIDNVTTSEKWNNDKLSGSVGFAIGIF